MSSFKHILNMWGIKLVFMNGLNDDSESEHIRNLSWSELSIKSRANKIASNSAEKIEECLGRRYVITLCPDSSGRDTVTLLTSTISIYACIVRVGF